MPAAPLFCPTRHTDSDHRICQSPVAGLGPNLRRLWLGVRPVLRQPVPKEEGAISERDDHPEDLPWNDAPADNEAPIGGSEPEPAEVSGEAGQERDTVAGPVPGPYGRERPDTLDERLAEEEPEASLRPAPDAWAGELVDPERAGGDVYRSEADDADDVDEPGAEEAAIHVRHQEDL